MDVDAGNIGGWAYDPSIKPVVGEPDDLAQLFEHPTEREDGTVSQASSAEDAVIHGHDALTR